VAALRERRVKIAYGGFCGGANQIAEWLDFAPDYLKLAPAIAKGVSRAGGGWRMVQSLVAVTRDLGCEVIAGGIDERSDAESLRELGCQYAQGDFFGPPEPLVKYLGRTPALAAAGY
jgi:EAL domain-containing protein (putative c-di-GMP-specific phosphodiesterase class I)